ncbi:MAG: selenocysteine-specific translation elongation factor [Pseudomonadales bacterium]|nr:selenocysteine-specific translation elongation factor [Pseudomonadales bacterium]
MIIATAGHVDHGKTLLVHAITGVDTDRLAEEKNRGLTIDLGFAYADMSDDCRLGFIDVPGNIKFISNMLAVVGAIDFALLVVAADDGPMPQTLEHLAILDLLGVSRGAVALTKIDRVDEARVKEVTTAINEMLEGTHLEGIPVFPVSAVAGTGIDQLTDTLVSASRDIQALADKGYFRLAIDRCFTVKGSGLVVTGSVFAGEVNVDDEVYLKPANIPLRIRGIHIRNRPSDRAWAGERCALNVTGQNIGRDSIHRGNWLVTNRDHAATDRLDARIQVLNNEKKPLRHWTPVHVHSAANHVTGRLATLEGDRIEPGRAALVQLVLDEPINLCRGDRLIIRDQAATRTLGGGTVIDAFSPRRGRARPERLAHLQALTEPEPANAIPGLLKVHTDGIYLPRLLDNLNLPPAEGKALLDACNARVFGDYALSPEALNLHKDAMMATLEDFHRSHRESMGLTPQQLRDRLTARLPDALMDALLEELTAESKIEKRGSLLQLPGHSATLSGPEESLWERVRPILEQEPTRPPVVHDLAKQVNLPPAAVEKLLARIAQLGYLVRPVKNRFFLPAGMEELEQTLYKLSEQSDDGMFSVRDYRDATDIGRNLCVELLEYFDRVGVTRRVGDRRKILHNADD